MNKLTELKKEDDLSIIEKILTKFTKELENKRYFIQLENKFKKSKNINVKDNDGWNYLMLASHKGDFAIVKLLLDMGANIDDKDNTCSTSLMFACYSGHFVIVKLLLERGANVNLTNNHGDTAFHNACKYKPDILIIKELLVYGADPNIKNKYNEKPIDIFQGTENEKREVEQLIKQSIILHGVKSIDRSIDEHNNPFGVNVPYGFENFKNLTEYIGGKRRKTKKRNTKGAYKRPEKYVPKNKTRKIQKNYK
jgi:ankyrin repeat protein